MFLFTAEQKMEATFSTAVPATLLVAGSGLFITLLKLGSGLLQAARTRSWTNWKRAALLKMCGPCFGRRCCGPVEDEDAVCGICHGAFGLRTPLQCSICSFTYHRCCIESWQKCKVSGDMQLGPETASCPACRTIVSIKAPSLGEKMCRCFFPVSTS
jgi:hypothetical protein